jgi:hypothetical protein
MISSLESLTNLGLSNLLFLVSAIPDLGIMNDYSRSALIFLVQLECMLLGVFLGYFYYLPAYRHAINLVKVYIARPKVTKYLVHNRFGLCLFSILLHSLSISKFPKSNGVDNDQGS